MKYFISMQNRFGKLAALLLLLVGGFFLWRFYPFSERVEKQIGDELFPLKDAEVIVYETEASGPQDCTSQEKYDKEGVCAFLSVKPRRSATKLKQR